MHVIEKTWVRGWVVKEKFLGLDPGYKFVTFEDVDGKHPFKANGLTFEYPYENAYCIDNHSITYVLNVDSIYSPYMWPHFEEAEFEICFCTFSKEDKGAWYSDKILIRS
jgi:hypothetical protein